MNEVSSIVNIKSSSEVPSPLAGEGADRRKGGIYQIPGKTFLLGEYAALYGGPALIACTKPYFEFSDDGKSPATLCSAAPFFKEGAILSQSTLALPLDKTLSAPLVEKTLPVPPFAKGGLGGIFHPQSPAGLFIADKFQDPHHLITQPIADTHHFSWHVPACYQSGGFGASTAEFLSVYYYYLELTHQPLCLDTLYTDYLKYAYHGTGTPPSGYDLIAQTQSQLVYVAKNYHHFTTEKFDWPFSNWHLLLFKTPIKLPTHEHLAALKPLSILTLEKLNTITEQGQGALQNSDINQWMSCINTYGKILQDENLVAKNTQEYLDALTLLPCPYAAKGCGALGADVLMVVVEKNNLNLINAWAVQYQLIQVASEKDL